jgi:predicted RNase H-like nuclease
MTPRIAVLGIDAAWTRTKPSGIALIDGGPGEWRWVRVAPSYGAFVAGDGAAPVSCRMKRTDPPLDVDGLLATCRTLLDGRDVDLVTIDMPVSTARFSGRRAADNEISRELGAAKASVHSPTATRPGRLGEELTACFAHAGFSVATNATTGATMSKLVEVYPHAALLTLLGLRERFRYKVSRSRAFWPRASVPERRVEFLAAFAKILSALVGETSPSPFALPDASVDAPLAALKAYEDAIDAMVCAWVGARYVEGRARAWGDSTAAIWAPSSRVMPYRLDACAWTAKEAGRQRIFVPRDVADSNKLAFSLAGYRIAEEVGFPLDGESRASDADIDELLLLRLQLFRLGRELHHGMGPLTDDERSDLETLIDAIVLTSRRRGMFGGEYDASE